MSYALLTTSRVTAKLHDYAWCEDKTFVGINESSPEVYMLYQRGLSNGNSDRLTLSRIVMLRRKPVIGTGSVTPALSSGTLAPTALL